MNIQAIIPCSSKLHSFVLPASSLSSFAVPDRTQNRSAGLVSTLTHEIRNPLCNINLALEILQSTDLDGVQKQYLEIIMRGSNRIRDLVNDLLIADKTEEAVSEFYFLDQLLDEVLVLARDRIILKNITVSTEYMATEHRVLLDKEKMKIALTNIIINAIDAMPFEKGELKLVTRSMAGLDIIEIGDNGIGISKENLGKIFQPYFTNKPGGMGLGLSATLEILRVNHTRVDVQSVEGKGTNFILSFEKM